MGKFLRTSLLVLVLAGGATAYLYQKDLLPTEARSLVDDALVKFDEYTTEESAEQELTEVVEQKPKQPEVVEAVEPEYQLQPVPTNPFANIDQHARACPKRVAKEVPSLAAYLAESCKTDLEKARSIYIWLTHNVGYDDKGFNSGKYSDCSAEGVLKNRVSVCDGFAELYLTLGKEMGLEIQKVVGYAKGYGYRPGSKFKESDHAWNIINVDGNWRVFDATWGEGHGVSKKGKLVSTKKFDEYWFNVDPYEAIFTHLPEHETQARVSPSLDLATYEKFPQIASGYFSLGFDGRTCYADALKYGGVEPPKIYSSNTYIKVMDAPLYEGIKVGKEYEYKFFAPQCYELVLIDADGDWTKFEREKGVFTLNHAVSKKGEISINAKYENGGSQYWGILKYQAKGKPSA